MNQNNFTTHGYVLRLKSADSARQAESTAHVSCVGFLYSDRLPASAPPKTPGRLWRMVELSEVDDAPLPAALAFELAHGGETFEITLAGHQLAHQLAARGIDILCGLDLEPSKDDSAFGQTPHQTAQILTLFIDGLQAGGVELCGRFPSRPDNELLPLRAAIAKGLSMVEVDDAKAAVASGCDVVISDRPIAIGAADTDHRPTPLQNLFADWS